MRTAVPTIFKHNTSQSTGVNFTDNKMRNEKKDGRSETTNSAVSIRISNCWSEQNKNQAKKGLLNAINENPNPLDNDPVRSKKQNTNGQSSFGLENIPVTGSDILKGSHIEFSYSTPKKLNELTPILEKWSPKNNNTASIIEDLIDSSDDDDDQSDEEANDSTNSNHVVYIDEDLVKQERFVDENSDEDFDCESSKSSTKDEEELNSTFDENKIKQQFHITDNVCIKLPKLDVSEKLLNKHRLILRPSSKITSEISNRRSSSSSSSSRKKSPTKPSRFRKSSKNSKTRRKIPRTSARFEQANDSTNNKRQSLRLSGRSPEIKSPELLDFAPWVATGDRKRIRKESNSKSTATLPAEQKSSPRVTRQSKVSVEKEPRNEKTSRSRSPSPSAYKHLFEVIFACQCCEQKYATVEQVKAHIKTHFPNCLTN